MNPLPKLHRSLIPDLSAQWKPPIFYYGWSIGDLLQRLLDYAEEHGLTRYYGTGTLLSATRDRSESAAKLRSDQSAESDSGEAQWSDIEDDDEDEDLEPEVDILSTAQSALWTMTGKAGIRLLHLQIYQRPFQLCGVLHAPHKIVISAYSNYELDRAIPEEDIEKLRKYLGIQEAPAWYPAQVSKLHRVS
ncbi:hypothetical protein FOMPIDRAFT_117363 [Fomitopsis schrenkii]|uniref:Uncharacterized protein n=1 Tax=Fomitopsis schrenkii TaxID=2126942 RepID=S8EZA2_FOMSC|nr:hypothetical protein FOMPIDRAFT_117363 [Fomitopsis schrenkii]